ncbi:unnamed protein product [Plutella xylostella]|uniref:(diamondback moth) hypothetical protein n=1 Tax=Plutella xylostella TaxID=51655 RepID=A0A8S4G3C0_PLUXY|nr:unnamed protein product [Plutella xylostella]
MEVLGFNENSTIIEKRCKITFESKDNQFTADDFYHEPGEVDMIIGAELFFELLCIGRHRLGDGQPTLQKTRLGWVVTGSIPGASPPPHFGLKCAPYIATRCLTQLANENKGEYPLASAAIQHDFLMDDYVHGDDDERRLAETSVQVDRILSTANFKLRKWKSNSKTILNELQQIQCDFWRRWSRDYIGLLQERTKWRSCKGAGLDVGTIVLIKDDRLPPCQWRLGRIVGCCPGRDGITRVGLGWIGDRPWISVGALYSVCLALCGACVAAMPPAAANFWLLAAVSCTFGLLFAGAFTFTPSLLVELVSLDQFTSAYGLVLLAQGIGHLIGPPLSGYIYDVTFSWELSFYLSGGCIVLAGALIALIPMTRNFTICGQGQGRRRNSEVDSLA